MMKLLLPLSKQANFFVVSAAFLFTVNPASASVHTDGNGSNCIYKDSHSSTVRSLKVELYSCYSNQQEYKRIDVLNNNRIVYSATSRVDQAKSSEFKVSVLTRVQIKAHTTIPVYIYTKGNKITVVSTTPIK